MDKTMKKFFTWLVDNYLSNWIVSREDYETVRRQRDKADQTNHFLLKEQSELYDSLYSRKYKPFEKLVDSTLIKVESIQKVDTRTIDLNTAIRIPAEQFYCTFNPKEEVDHIVTEMVNRLALYFRERIKLEIFKRV
jgi:hypothetical protein